MNHYLAVGSLVASLAGVSMVVPAAAQPNTSFGDILYQGTLKEFRPPNESDEQSCKSVKGRAMVRHQLYSKGIELIQCSCVPHTGTWGKRKACSIKYTAQLNQKAYDQALALDEREKQAGRKGGSER